MTQASPLVRPVASKADRNAFVDLPYRLYASDPNWVPPLKDEVHGLITPGKNPWFEHGEAQLYLAERDGRIVDMPDFGFGLFDVAPEAVAGQIGEFLRD